MSTIYFNTLQHINDRIRNLTLETQEKYFLEKLDLLLNYIKEKMETYSESKVLVNTYTVLVEEFKNGSCKIEDQGNKEVLFNICSDIEEEMGKLDEKYVS